MQDILVLFLSPNRMGRGFPSLENEYDEEIFVSLKRTKDPRPPKQPGGIHRISKTKFTLFRDPLRLQSTDLQRYRFPERDRDGTGSGRLLEGELRTPFLDLWGERRSWESLCTFGLTRILKQVLNHKNKMKIPTVEKENTRRFLLWQILRVERNRHVQGEPQVKFTNGTLESWDYRSLFQYENM